jgi:LysR family transcriptional activator of dmlA
VKHKTQIMNNLPLLKDLRVFMLVARRAGFAAVAEELGVSPAFISKRVALLEQTLNVVLLHRTTRRVTITEEGERIYEWAQRILQDVDQMMDELSDARQVPRGCYVLLVALVLAAGWLRRCRRWQRVPAVRTEVRC